MLRGIGTWLRQTAAQYPDQIALIEGSRQLSWRAVDQSCDQLCEYLHAVGVRSGSHVGIWSINSIEYVVLFLAVARLGGVSVPLNTALTRRELLEACKLADLTHLFYGEGYKSCLYAQAVEGLQKEQQTLTVLPIPCVSPWGEETEGTIPKGKCSAHCSPDWIYQAEENVEESQCATMLFTSGSSGVPKAVQLSHRNLLRNAEGIAEGMHWSQRDRFCVAVPFFHCFGITVTLLVAVCVGASLVILPRFRSKRCFEAIEQHSCTVLNGVPSMFLSMQANPASKEHDLGTIRSGIIAGSRLHPEEYRKILTLFAPSMHLQPSYGQTETSPCCTLAPWDWTVDQKANSSGLPIRGVQMRVVSLYGNDEVLPGTLGRIQTRGAHVMQGYYKNEEKNRRVFQEDGWLDTGDIGSLTSEGALVVNGRNQELIIRGGENISPSEVERAILQYPGVQQAQVFAVPDPILQEEICACVLEDPKHPLSVEALRLFLSEQLADHKIPKYIRIYHKFPLQGSGKLAMRQLQRESIRELGLEKPPGFPAPIPVKRETERVHNIRRQ